MANEIKGTRADTFEVVVHVEDVTNPNKPMLNLGVFDARTGGQGDSEETVYYPGAMGERQSLGGRQTADNVIVSRNYRIVRDHQQLINRLYAGRGSARMIVTQTPLDASKNAYGPPITWRGTLKRVSAPEHNSSSNDAAMLELEMTTDSGSPVAV